MRNGKGTLLFNRYDKHFRKSGVRIHAESVAVRGADKKSDIVICRRYRLQSLSKQREGGGHPRTPNGAGGVPPLPEPCPPKNLF